MSAANQIVIRLRLIGRMAAWTVAGEDILPEGRKTQALLAAVALAAPRPMRLGRLAELLWSHLPEARARVSLRQEIRRLEETLAPAKVETLRVTRDHFGLTSGAVWVDVAEVMRATVREPVVLSLLDNNLLDGMDGLDPGFNMWLSTERDRLLGHARRVAEAVLHEKTEPDSAIPAAWRLLHIDRAHEGAWRALMRAHTQRGERGLAVQAYDRCQAALESLYNVTPSPETQQLLWDLRRPSRPDQPTAWAPAQAPRPAVSGDVAEDDRRSAATDRPPRHIARVGVLPMRCQGLSREETHHGPGLTDELVVALSRYRWMSVVALQSPTRIAPGDGVRHDAAIGRVAGVDYVLDGAIRRGGETLRVMLQLVDPRAGNEIVWARRFDCLPNDLSSGLTEVANEAAAQIDPALLMNEARRRTALGHDNLTAHDLLLRSIPPMTRLDRDGFMRAGEYLVRAAALEPNFEGARTWHAFWHTLLCVQGWEEGKRETITRMAVELAERAMVLDPRAAQALAVAGHVRAYLQRRPREAVALHDQALTVNPNLAMAWGLSAITWLYLGETAEAERRMNRYKALSQHSPFAFFFDGFIAEIHLIKRDHHAAAAAAAAAMRINPFFAGGYKPGLAALGHLGRVPEARTVLRRLLAIEPDFTIERFLTMTPLEPPADRNHYAEGLRLAGAA